MTDRLYPSIPNLVGHPAGYQPLQADQAGNIAPNQSLQPYPMPSLPQNSPYEPSQLTSQLSGHEPMVAPETSEFATVDNEKLLQDVMWPQPDIGHSLVPNPAYPPMPSSAPMAMTGLMDDQTITNAPHGVLVSDNIHVEQADTLNALNPKSLMSSVRQHLASKPKPESPKTIIDKAQTEIVADPDKPRSQRSVFLTGALCGAVISYVLTTAIGNMVNNNAEAAKIAAAKSQLVSQDISEAQVESLNDDVSGIEAVTPDSVDEGGSFLDEQLKPDT